MKILLRAKKNVIETRVLSWSFFTDVALLEIITYHQTASQLRRPASSLKLWRCTGSWIIFNSVSCVYKTINTLISRHLRRNFFANMQSINNSIEANIWRVTFWGSPLLLSISLSSLRYQKNQIIEFIYVKHRTPRR